MIDPLHKWLGIPPSEQPPDDYRLLGIAAFEEDPEVIDSSADKQLAFLHGLSNGEHGVLAEELSNKVSAARIRLLNKESKAAYDDTLRSQQNETPQPPAARPGTAPPATAPLAEVPPVAVPPVVAPPTAPVATQVSANQVSAGNQTSAANRFSQHEQSLAPVASPQPSQERGEEGSGKRVRRKGGGLRKWGLTMIPAAIILAVIAWLLITGKARLDQGRIEALGVPKDVAESIADAVNANDEPDRIASAVPSDTKPNSVSVDPNEADMNPETGLAAVLPNTSSSDATNSSSATGAFTEPVNVPSTSGMDSTLGANSGDGNPSSGGINNRSTQPIVPETNLANGETSSGTDGGLVGAANVPAAAANPFVPMAADNPYANGKKPLPSKQDIAEKMKLVSGLYKEDYQKARSSADKLALAKQIVQAASETNDDPAGRLALMRVARDIFKGENDYLAAMDCIDGMAAYFQGVDSVLGKARVLGSVNKIPIGKKTQYISAVVSLANESLQQGNFGACDSLMRGAAKHLKSGIPSSKAKALQDAKNDYENARKLNATHRSALESLKVDAANQTANTAVGKYLCLVELHWQEGLANLAAGTDGPLRKAAATERGLANKTSTALQAGQAWYEAGKSTAGPLEKRRIFDRAREHFLTAKATSKGLDGLTIEKRLKEIERFNSASTAGGN